MKTAFKMKLKPGNAEEYKRRHDNIWPELKALLKENGISDYAIFLDEETNILFAVQNISDGITSQNMNKDPVIQRWWAYMADLMDTNPDNSPVIGPLKQVFHME